MTINSKMIAKGEEIVSKSAAGMLRAARDGRNAVSATRALEGSALVEGAYGSGKMMDNLAEDAGLRGPAARAKAVNAGAIAKKEGGDIPSFLGGMKKDVGKIDELKSSARGDNNAVHKMETLRNEKAGLIQYNGTGYDNAAMQNRKQINFSLNTPPSGITGTHNMQHTFDSRTNQTASAALLGQRTKMY